MSARPWLDIFVLCHNRPDKAKAAIASIVAQSERGYRLIVSDNSSDGRVAAMMGENFPDLELRQRGCVPALMHFNLCIAEASADWFCLFHDDDLMGTDFVAAMRDAIGRYPEAIAIGGNAWVVDQRSNRRHVGVLGFGDYQRIDGAGALFRRYFGRHQTGFVPFPAYIYRTERAGTERIPADGGKYADVTWLLKLAMRGPIVWCNRPLIYYHLHGDNDGLQESLRDRLRFLGFIKRCPGCAGRAGLTDYRYLLYKNAIAAGRGGPRRRGRLRRFITWARLVRLLRPSQLPAMLRKTVLKALSAGEA